MAKADTYAYGKVARGIMTISEDAVEGTVYHEAFHWVMQYILSDAERKQVYEEARKAYGTTSVKALEEHLADAFREWMLTGAEPGMYLRDSFKNRGFFKGIGEFFRRLWALVTNQRILMPHTLSVFTALNSGDYSKVEETFSETDSHGIIADNIEKAVEKVQKYKNPHVVSVVDYKVKKDGSAQIIFQTPEGGTINNQDVTFPKEHIQEAIDTIKDIYANGLGLDLTNGIESIYYSSETGFMFSTVLPEQTQSVGETLADFYKALGKTNLNFEYLPTSVKEDLTERGVSEERYNSWSPAEKDHTIRCIGVA